MLLSLEKMVISDDSVERMYPERGAAKTGLVKKTELRLV